MSARGDEQYRAIRKLKHQLATAEGLYQAERYRRDRLEGKLDKLRAIIADTAVPTSPVIDTAMVERAARALFEDPSVDGDYTWDDLLREDGPERADLWRDDARRILTAALTPEETP